MNASENYLNIQIQSATPSGLIVMLHNGLIRFASEAREEIIGGNAGRSMRVSELVDRSIRILTELNRSLNWEADPRLCGTLSDLYTFFTDQLSKALKESKPEPIQQILPLIEKLRDSWNQIDLNGVEAVPEAISA